MRRQREDFTIGIDVGGTSLRASVVNSTGQVIDSFQSPTPHSAKALEHGLDCAVAELAARHPVSAVGLAIAGFLNSDRTLVRFAPHLPWVDTPVARRMSDRIGFPVLLEHDANSAAWAEYRFGAAADGRNVVMIAIGTGIGAALLIDGRIYRGSFGIAPELGHIQVVPDGRACPCGKRGCWERYCSGTALVDTAVELLAAEQESSTILAKEAFLDPGSLTGRRISSAAQEGDDIGRRAMEDFAQWLGVGLAIVSDVYDPDLIVIAGGVATSSGQFLPEARDHYSQLVTGAGHRPLARIRSTQLGEAAGMIGAADLARLKFLSPARRQM